MAISLMCIKINYHHPVEIADNKEKIPAQIQFQIWIKIPNL